MRRGTARRSRGGPRRPPPQANGAHGPQPLRMRAAEARDPQPLLACAAVAHVRAAAARGPRRGEVATMAPRGRGEAPQRRERG